VVTQKSTIHLPRFSSILIIAIRISVHRSSLITLVQELYLSPIASAGHLCNLSKVVFEFLRWFNIRKYLLIRKEFFVTGLFCVSQVTTSSELKNCLRCVTHDIFQFERNVFIAYIYLQIKFPKYSNHTSSPTEGSLIGNVCRIIWSVRCFKCFRVTRWVLIIGDQALLHTTSGILIYTPFTLKLIKLNNQRV